MFFNLEGRLHSVPGTTVVYTNRSHEEHNFNQNYIPQKRGRQLSEEIPANIGNHAADNSFAEYCLRGKHLPFSLTRASIDLLSRSFLAFG